MPVKETSLPFSYDGLDSIPVSLHPPPLTVIENGQEIKARPLGFKLVKPTDAATGLERDQTHDAANNMRYAFSLGLPNLGRSQIPKMGKAIIVGGAPSVRNHLKEIRQLAKDPDNWIFALNWTHTWLLEHGIKPKGTVFFEIDAEPETILKKAQKGIWYFICSHCHQKTFDMLKDYDRVVWHSPPNSPAEEAVSKELYPMMWDKDPLGQLTPGPHFVTGGVGSFTRTIVIALMIGFRNIHLFGCDASFPEGSKSTHVEGYETINDVKTDAFFFYGQNRQTGEYKKFWSVGYLILQGEEFKEFCRLNHGLFALRVHGDENTSWLKWMHKLEYPGQYA